MSQLIQLTGESSMGREFDTKSGGQTGISLIVKHGSDVISLSIFKQDDGTLNGRSEGEPRRYVWLQYTTKLPVKHVSPDLSSFQPHVSQRVRLVTGTNAILEILAQGCPSLVACPGSVRLFSRRRSIVGLVVE